MIASLSFARLLFAKYLVQNIHIIWISVDRLLQISHYKARIRKSITRGQLLGMNMY